MHNIRRRTFFKAGLGLAGLALLNGQVAYAKNKQYQELLALINKILPHIKSSTNLGRLLLSANKISTKDSNTFITEVFFSPLPNNITLEQHLSNRVYNDFKDAKIIEIDNWQLSRTECLLAASAHIIKQKTLV